MGLLERLRLLFRPSRPIENGQDFQLIEKFVELEESHSRRRRQQLTQEEQHTIRVGRLKRAIDKYNDLGWPMELATLERLWQCLAYRAHTENVDREKKDADPFYGHEAVTKFFDFSTGPMGHAAVAGERALVKKYDRQENRFPPGMKPQQNIFLESVQTDRVDPTPRMQLGELDKFSMAIADLRGYDGIYCLSGTRGSGKSSVLNRIAWFCRHWFDQTGAPLLVRFDLGTTFDRKIFVRDLLAEICLATKTMLRRPPFALPFGLGWSTRAIGHLGRLCQANVAWAAVATVGLLLLLHHSTLYHHTNDNGKVHEASDQNCYQSPIEFNVLLSNPHADIGDCHVQIPFFGGWPFGEIHLILRCLVGFMFLGICYHLRSLLRGRQREGGRKPVLSGYVQVQNTAVLLIACLVILAVVLTESHPVLSDVLKGKYWWLSYCVSLVMLAVAIGLIPDWWDSYLYFDRMHSRLRSEPVGRMADVPFFGTLGSLGWLVARLLPNSETPDQVDKVSEPFIQELTKQALLECTSSFDRVVVLIDDIDALPSDKFHEILRIIRPLSKVQGVRCVLATPLLFHFALKQKSFSDIHSTVQGSVVVGDKELVPNWREEPGEVTKDKAKLQDFLIELVVSRLRFPLVLDLAERPKYLIDMIRSGRKEDRESARKAVLNSKSFGFILNPWIERHNQLTAPVFERYGTSRREIIRMLRQSTSYGFRQDLKSKNFDLFMETKSGVFSRLKDEYGLGETELICNLSGPEEYTFDSSTDTESQANEFSQ